MDRVLGWLWPIMSLGAVGGLVDFLLGKSRRERTRGLLETWWIIFSDVHWRNFGQKGALLTVHLIDRYCGRLFSIRRALVVLMTFTAAAAIGCLSALVLSGSFIYPERRNQIIFVAHLIIGIIGLTF